MTNLEALALAALRAYLQIQPDEPEDAYEVSGFAPDAADGDEAVVVESCRPLTEAEFATWYCMCRKEVAA